MLRLAKKSLKKHESEAERMIREWNQKDDAKYRRFYREMQAFGCTFKMPGRLLSTIASRRVASAQTDTRSIEQKKNERHTALNSMVESCRRAYVAGDPIESFFAGFLRASDTRGLILKLREERVAYAILFDLKEANQKIHDQYALWERRKLETDQALQALAHRFGPKF